jgi:hypothetical protein
MVVGALPHNSLMMRTTARRGSLATCSTQRATARLIFVPPTELDSPLRRKQGAFEGFNFHSTNRLFHSMDDYVLSTDETI